MKEYFKSVLKRMGSLIGTKPLQSMTLEEAKAVVDACVKVSELFPYIPQDKQKEIIDKCLLTDQTYLNLNARLIYKFLNEHGKQYFKEQAHEPTEETVEPLTGEERERWLNTWQKSLVDLTETFAKAVSPKGGGSRIRESLNAKGIVVPDEIAIAKKEASERLKAYKLANYGADGNALETWLPESEWMKINYPETKP